MAQITDTGAVGRTLDEYLTILENLFKSVFGADFDVSTETPQGQVIGLLALIFSEADEAIVKTSNGTSIFRACGQQLDGLTAILSTLRDDAERSQVTVTLTGVPSTVIPAGSRARSVNNDLFVLDDDVQLDGTGTATATMFSVETGIVSALAGEISNIVDVVPGWETVNNAAAASLGQSREVDQLLVQRYFRELFRNATSVIRSVEGLVSALEGVTDVIARENDTPNPIILQNVTIPPHSIAVVVEGGGNTEIAEAIVLRKTGGTGTTGTTSVTLPDRPSGIPITFFRPTPIEILVNINVSLTPDVVGNVQALINERLMNYVNGNFIVDTEGFFETDGLNIAETLYLHRLYTAVNSVQGIIINNLTLQVKGTGVDVTEIPIDLDQKITISDSADITITVV